MIESRPTCTKIILALCSLFCVLLLLVATCSAAEPQSQPQQITMSLEQYNKLNKMLTEQEQVLNKLRTRINRLEMPSNELILQLETAERELENSRLNLELSMQNLNGALLSISKLKESLNKLSVEVSRLEGKAKHRQQQRDVGYVLILLALLI